MGRVVVGIDGSANARRALRWAIAEARQRGAELHIVHAMRPPHRALGDRSAVAAASIGSTRYLDPGADQAKREEAYQNARNESLGRINLALKRIDADVSDLTVEKHPVVGVHPERALIEVAQNADLLVVGSRGRGAVSGRLMGSVSRACVEHANCPVVVIPPDADHLDVSGEEGSEQA